jgi:hypothetical protein
MPQHLTWTKAIEKVLRESPDAMHYKEITEKILAGGLRQKVGATPEATVSSHLTTEINTSVETSKIIRVARGVYIWAEKLSECKLAPQKEDVKKINDVDDEPQYGIISSLGMYWKREDVDWNAKMKMLGKQTGADTCVDFCRQIGIYLLYDAREVIYVGRALDRPIFQRMKTHTSDRLSTRWNRFSWFGFLPVDAETVKLKEISRSHSIQKLISALEAVLIEALEPRQNRRGGDDLSMIEYNQVVDPQIEEKQKKAFIADFLMNK